MFQVEPTPDISMSLLESKSAFEFVQENAKALHHDYR